MDKDENGANHSVRGGLRSRGGKGAKCDDICRGEGPSSLEAGSLPPKKRSRMAAERCAERSRLRRKTARRGGKRSENEREGRGKEGKHCLQWGKQEARTLCADLKMPFVSRFPEAQKAPR